MRSLDVKMIDGYGTNLLQCLIVLLTWGFRYGSCLGCLKQNRKTTIYNGEVIIHSVKIINCQDNKCIFLLKIHCMIDIEESCQREEMNEEGVPAQSTSKNNFNHLLHPLPRLLLLPLLHHHPLLPLHLHLPRPPAKGSVNNLDRLLRIRAVMKWDWWE